MKLYLYIRLSSSDVDLKYKAESDSVANQRALLRQFVAGRREFYGWDIEEFVDDGYTGTNGERPAFERMIRRLKDGDGTVVICKDFSRFFRDYTELGDYLERIFPFLGVRFISVNDGYDSDEYKGTTAGMEVVMKYIIYSYYSRDLSMKSRAAAEVRMKAGEYSYPFPPYGYQKNPDKKRHLIPDPEAAPIVRKVFELAIAGHSAGEIARKLNQDGVETPSKHFHKKFPQNKRFSRTSALKCWDAVNIRVLLRRYEYTGACVFHKKQWKRIDHPQVEIQDPSQWLIVPNCHEAIVTEEEFNQAQAVIQKYKKVSRSKQEYPLRSLVRCGVCGRVMKRNSSSKHINYRCALSGFSKNPVCPINEVFDEAALERVVVQSLRQMLSLLVENVRLVKDAAIKTRGSEASLRQSILKLEKSIKQNQFSRVSGYEQYADGKLSRDGFLVLKGQLALELEQLTAQKAAEEQELAALEAANDSELAAWEKDATGFLKAEQVTNQMLLHFIECVNVYTGMRVEIKYRFSDELMTLLADAQVDNDSTRADAQ